MELSDKLVAAAMKNLEKLLISKGLTAKSLISKFDMNNDGLINFDEFDKGLTKLTGSPAPRSYLAPIFSAIDLDGNGTLNQNELMALLGIENKTAIDSNSLNISEHTNEKYNGTYMLQDSKINNKPWYMNSNNCRLYFYNANEGGAPSWSLDNREQDGSYDWYDGGWTRVPADQNIPIGIRRFVGAGKIKISVPQDNGVASSSEDSPAGVLSENSNMMDDTDSTDVVELVDEEFDMTTFVTRWSNELEKMVENSSSPEAIDSILLDADLKFEQEVSQLPLITQVPVRAIWKIKSDTVVTIAKTQLSSNSANIITGLGIAGAAVGAVSSIDREGVQIIDDSEIESNVTPIVSENSPSSKDWHDDHHVEAPDRVERVTQMSSAEWERTHHVEAPDRVELPDRVTVSKASYSKSNIEASKETIVEETLDPSVNELSSPVITNSNSTFTLDEIIMKMNDARFITEQRELLTNFKGKTLELSFRVSSIDRTFGIDVSEEYKGGKTLLVNSNSHDIEVRVKKEFDTSRILSGSEMVSNVSIADWNGIRKRLVVDLH